jgi:hypothetical protein
VCVGECRRWRRGGLIDELPTGARLVAAAFHGRDLNPNRVIEPDRVRSVYAKLRPHGQTGLHWAAYGGHAGTVRVLLQHHAPVDVKDDRFETTPLSWALYAWSGGREHWAGEAYYEIVEQLLRAGARFDDEWLKQNGHASPTAKRIDEDARMRAILSETR